MKSVRNSAHLTRRVMVSALAFLPALREALRSSSAQAQAQTNVGPRAAPRMKMTTDIPLSITTPDAVQTRIGTPKFFDGFPDKATVDKVYDNLDFHRGVQAYLTALPAVSIEGARGGVTGFGPVNQTALIAEQLLDSRSLFLTANTTTPYTVALFEHEGWSVGVGNSPSGSRPVG